MAPRPGYRLPMLPPVSVRFAQNSKHHEYASTFDREGVAWCSRGCDALTLVYRQAQLAPHDVVLIPAFHCPSIATATRHAGLQIAFHGINPDLTPVEADVVRQLKGGARALLLIHYFGFMQDAKRYRSLCDQFGAILIEDCAHTFFGLSGELLPGETGHFAIASQRKLFPIPDGGAAIANDGPIDSNALQPVSWINELRASLHAIQQAADYATLGPASRPISMTLDWLDKIRSTMRGDRTAALASTPSADEGKQTGPSLSRGSRVSLGLSHSTSVGRLARIRRSNYQHLVSRLQHVPNCAVLFPDLLPGTVPYVVPVVVRNAQQNFQVLKSRGVPMFRWEGIGELGCDVTRAYATDLIQLPCHQELSPGDIDWIADQVSDVVIGSQA